MVYEDIKSPQIYESKLNELQSKLNPILDDYKEYYVLHNNNPTSNEYQRFFENIKQNVDKLMNNIKELSNNLDADLINLGKEMDNINNTIVAIKKE